ncbi:hypothetical protein ABMA67_02545 [Halobacteriovorax sp. RZ-3]|uniref:hypothetical protein n=1 Tax=Halobacteriovorax sp. RZ-3 TaxID=3157720 RepID=UPI003723480B
MKKMKTEIKVIAPHYELTIMSPHKEGDIRNKLAVTLAHCVCVGIKERFYNYNEEEPEISSDTIGYDAWRCGQEIYNDMVFSDEMENIGKSILETIKKYINNEIDFNTHFEDFEDYGWAGHGVAGQETIFAEIHDCHVYKQAIRGGMFDWRGQVENFLLAPYIGRFIGWILSRNAEKGLLAELDNEKEILLRMIRCQSFKKCFTRITKSMQRNIQDFFEQEERNYEEYIKQERKEYINEQFSQEMEKWRIHKTQQESPTKEEFIQAIMNSSPDKVLEVEKIMNDIRKEHS